MMEHFRQYDWCSSQRESHFVREEDLDNCVTEKILRNKFIDPLLVNDDSDSDAPLRIDWDEILKRRENDDQSKRKFVPGMRASPPYPKLSALSSQQHYQCLKVLCSEHPHVLKSEFIPRPTKQDYKVFEEVQAIYKKEQKEYMEWAKTQWNHKCIRALHTKPAVEVVYDAEFKMKAHMLKCFPKSYDFAAQIPLESKHGSFDMVFKKELIGVKKKDLPQIDYPETIDVKINIINTIPLPEPCNKHPCPFVLPNENTVSILPLTEIHKELATYALDNGAQCVASESALKCLVELDRNWNIPLSVCPALSSDGNTTNIVILGSEFANNKEDAQTRTYRAFRHLLEIALIPTSEQHKVSSRADLSFNTLFNNSNDSNHNNLDDQSDDEGDNLFIDDVFEQNDNSDTEALQIDENTDNMDIDSNLNVNEEQVQNTNKQTKHKEIDSGIFKCTCKDSMYEKPPPRSFKTWQLRNSSTGDSYDMIVHCAHKVRAKIDEIILEPIPEYQIDMGASQVSKDRIKSLALTLLLRQSAALLNVRVECPSGDIVTIDNIHQEDFARKHGYLVPDIANTLHTTLNQLQGLLPGHYILQHEASHGSNALLMAPRGDDSGTLRLHGGGDKEGEGGTRGTGGTRGAGTGGTDEAAALIAPPLLEPALLPVHKFRKILPCAFTTNPKYVAKEPKKPPAKMKTPPQAITWPKKRSNKKKQNNRR